MNDPPWTPSSCAPRMRTVHFYCPRRGTVTMIWPAWCWLVEWRLRRRLQDYNSQLPRHHFSSAIHHGELNFDKPDHECGEMTD
jgi:hypothetical protein